MLLLNSWIQKAKLQTGKYRTYMKFVFSFHVSSILISQYPSKKSSVVKMLLSHKPSKISSTQETGHLPVFITAFNFRKSMQNLGLPFFFLANTTGDVHANLTGAIIPAYSIRSTSSLTISSQARNSRLNLGEIGSCYINSNLSANSHL